MTTHPDIQIKSKFRVAAFLIFIPVVGNLVLCFLILQFAGDVKFKGYLVGTLLTMFFSIIWVWIARKATFSNAMVLFTYSLGSFPVKLVIFALFAFVGLYVIKMDQVFFGLSFLSGTIASLLIEVWFMISISKLVKKYRSELKKEKSENP